MKQTNCNHILKACMNWQPIETAPTDGTNVFVLIDMAGTPVVHIAWHQSPEEWERQGQYAGGWASLEDWQGWWSYTRNSVGIEKIKAPTHWVPLELPNGVMEP